MEKDSCPLCAALPGDWCNDPHPRYERAAQIISALHAIMSGASRTGLWNGRDAGQWTYSARQWLLDEPE